MTSRPDKPDGSPRPKKNLLTIGSAAVLAVYAAGFVRTRAAAQRFADDSDLRRTTSPVAPADTATVANVPMHIDSVRPSVPQPRRAAPTHLVPPRTAQTLPDSQRTVVAPPVVVAEPPVVPVTVVADTTPPPIDKPLARWKDGRYLGYGTSRHGDIEASVEIKDGRIIAASITQCLTRYSCSWISHLPPQVVARQSPDVDYVSGATQSSNAFYQAIAEALTKAK